MGRYIIATIKSWNIEKYHKLTKQFPMHEFILITEKEGLTEQFCADYKPDYIFFPHWSWIIPASIYEDFNCVVFHMTDLPFGRGGSPLQNLLVRGFYDTKISAIKVSEGMDTGDVYFKEELDISKGSADEILSRASDIIFTKMIPRFLKEDITPFPQSGTVVEFKRRIPEQSEIPERLSQRQIYDYIRMLDGEGYPTAYKKYNDGRIYFTNAQYEDGVTTATARFVGDEN